MILFVLHFWKSEGKTAGVTWAYNKHLSTNKFRTRLFGGEEVGDEYYHEAIEKNTK